MKIVGCLTLLSSSRSKVSPEKSGMKEIRFFLHFHFRGYEGEGARFPSHSQDSYIIDQNKNYIIELVEQNNVQWSNIIEHGAFVNAFNRIERAGHHVCNSIIHEAMSASLSSLS